MQRCERQKNEREDRNQKWKKRKKMEEWWQA